MRIPKEFYLKGNLWRVEYKWRLQEFGVGKCDGLCDFSIRTIFLDRLLPKDEKPKVFIHEYMRAIIHEIGGINGILEELPACLLENFTMKWRRQC